MSTKTPTGYRPSTLDEVQVSRKAGHHDCDSCAQPKNPDGITNRGGVNLCMVNSPGGCEEFDGFFVKDPA